MNSNTHAYQDAIEVESALLQGIIDLRAHVDTPGHLSSLDPEMFMDPHHGLIWKAFQAISEKSGVIDSWSVNRVIRKLGGADRDIAVAENLFLAAANGFGSSDLRPRIAKVADAFKRKLLGRSMAALSDKAMTGDLLELEAEFSEVAGKVAQAGNPRLRVSTDYAVQFEAYLSGEPILPLESRSNLTVTGIPGLDDALVANPGRLIVVGGLPSTGKTALAVQFGVKTALSGRRVAMGSLEMDADEIAARIVACACSVNSLEVLRHGPRHVNHEDRAILKAVRANLVGLHGCAGDSWSSLEAAIIREHRRSPLSLAIVDYLQLVGEPETNRKRKAGTEAEAIGEITKAGKKLAQRLGINVLILSQFNRNVEECQEPTLQNFLGSGQIERDCDIALMLWNTEKCPDPKANRPVSCRVAKNRGGERYGKFRMSFNPAYSQFREVVEETEPALVPCGANNGFNIGK